MTKLARLALASVGLVALGIVAVAVNSARRELQALKSERWPVPRLKGEAWFDPAVDIDLVTPSGTRAHGWLLPSRNGAGIVLVTGAYADRRQLAAEARIFSQAGYGVVMFDLPGNGESDGPRWKGHEQETVTAAIDLLISRGASDPSRVGAFGFSVGAALVADATARDPRVRAVVLAGCITRWEDQARYESGAWGPISALPTMWVDSIYTGGTTPLDPAASIPKISPRPILLLAGDMDSTVPWANTPKLYALAAEPKEVWIVPGASHGNYASIAPEAYPARLIAFFDRALHAKTVGAAEH